MAAVGRREPFVGAERAGFFADDLRPLLRAVAVLSAGTPWGRVASDRGAVRGDGGVGLLAGMGRQPRGRSPRDREGPEVTLSRKRDQIAVEGGEALIALVLAARRRDEEDEEADENRESHGWRQSCGNDQT